MRPIGGLFVLANLTLTVAGCRGGAETNRPATGESVQREASSDPVTLTLRVTPATPDVSKHAEVVVEAVADRDVTVDLENYERELLSGDHRFEYRIVRSEQKAAVPTPNGRLSWTLRFELAFTLPGEYELPPARLSFVAVPSRAGEDGVRSANPPSSDVDLAGAEPTKLETEPIKVIVSGPDAAQLTEAELAKITVLDPVELRRPWSHRWWIAAIIALALVLPIVALTHRSRRNAVEQAFVLPAHEWAWRQIALLIADDLIAKSRVQEFYYRISDVVRGYIERRFAVSAAEMTTEEFLIAAATDHRFNKVHREELSRFLQACDLVKYARHVPHSGEADSLLAATRHFIEQTRERSSVEQRHETAPAHPTERAG